MKRTVFLASLIILSLIASASSPANRYTKSERNENSISKSENRLTEEEFRLLTKRVEEIRDMDKSGLKAAEKRELRKELKGIKENIRRDGGYIYIGGGTLLLIIILVILLV